ncbi:hypothetical protein FQZ97_1109660 [compost metagenome]
MPCVAQHLQHAAHEPQLAFDGLVGVGHGADGEQLGHMARAGEFALEHLGDVALGDQLGLEINARRQIEKTVAGPRVAIHTAVLAPPVRVEAEVKADVGRVVVGDGAFRVFKAHFGGRWWCLVARQHRVVERAPAVVKRFAGVALEAVRLVLGQAAALDGLQRNVGSGHG